MQVLEIRPTQIKLPASSDLRQCRFYDYDLRFITALSAVHSV